MLPPFVWHQGKLHRGDGTDGNFLQKDVCQPCCILWPWPCSKPVNPPLHQRLDTQATLAQSLVASLLLCSFLLGPGAHNVLFVPYKSLFCQSCGSSVIKSHWPSKSNSLGVLSPLPDPQVGKSVVSPRTFLTVRELLWYSWSPVCGLSSQWLYGGANGDLLQEDLCHMPCLLGLQQPEPLSPLQATADPCLCRRHSNIQRQVWLSLWGVSGSQCAQGFVRALQLQYWLQ